VVNVGQNKHHRRGKKPNRKQDPYSGGGQIEKANPPDLKIVPASNGGNVEIVVWGEEGGQKKKKVQKNMQTGKGNQNRVCVNRVAENEKRPGNKRSKRW